jgi:cleavage and polyadenylation specificity factor subunit 6/7
MNGGDYQQQAFDGPSTSTEAPPAVFISNLQWWTTDVELETLCSEFGPVTGIRFIEDRACGKSRGMAVVDFATPHAVQACIDGLGGRDINGRPCRVTRQVQRGAGTAPGGGPGRGMPGRGGVMMGRGPGGGRGGMGPSDPGMMMMSGAGAGAGGGGMDPSMMWGGGMGMNPQMMGMGGPMMGMGGFRPPPPPAPGGGQ